MTEEQLKKGCLIRSDSRVAFPAAFQSEPCDRHLRRHFNRLTTNDNDNNHNTNNSSNSNT